jgi:HAD superfamily hydrolase (TIGR01509 family)
VFFHLDAVHLFLNLTINNLELKNLNSQIRCVIFDCDGVLVDSEILASQASLRMLKPYGFTMSPKEYSHLFAGKVEEDILAIIQRDYHINLPDDFLSKVRLEIEHSLDHELQAIKGVKETIAKIPVTKAVVSNSRLVRVISSLKVAGLSEIFGKNLFAAEMVKRPKPAPDVYLHAASELGFEPSACLVVEDSQSGVTAAHRAGMNVIGFLGASHIPDGHERTVREVGAFTTASNMEALGRMFQEVFGKGA